MFSKKCLIPSKRVCLRLKSLRDASGISLEELEKKTKISKKYLQAIEECNFEMLKYSAVYQKNFIKKYVSALGEDPTPFIEQFTEEELSYKPRATQQKKFLCSKWHLRSLPLIIRYALVGAATLSLVFYLGLHVKNILRPPSLSVVEPTEGMVTQKNSIQVTGTTEPETKITINGENINNDEKGNFEQTILLSPGINTLVINAYNKHGKNTSETRHIIYKNIDYITLAPSTQNTN